MEEEPVLVIRESTRNLLKLNRQQHRGEVSDVNRTVCDLRITPERVSNISQNLKSKSSIEASDLNALKNGLMDDPNNITVVLNTNGALRGLVRELTGHEVRKQCAAAGCLCNLALGDYKTCNTITKAAGSYLITALDNLTTELAVTCAWTIGNLAGSSARVCELLVSQGALPKLSDMLHGNEDVQDAALYALVHLVYQLRDELRMDHLSRILQQLQESKLTMLSAQLLFALSCHQNFPENVTEDLLQKIINDLLNSVNTHLSVCQNQGSLCCELVYLLRVLANMDMNKVYGIVLEQLIRNNLNVQFSKILMSSNKSVCESLLWFLGNLFNYNCDNQFFHSLLNS